MLTKISLIWGVSRCLSISDRTHRHLLIKGILQAQVALHNRQELDMFQSPQAGLMAQLKGSIGLSFGGGVVVSVYKLQTCKTVLFEHPWFC